MKTIAYLRVSKNDQDLDNQKLVILDFARKNQIAIDEFVEIAISSRKNMKERRLEDLLDLLNDGDRLIVSELSRLGRSISQIIMMIDSLIAKNIKFVAIKENILIDGAQDIQSKVMVTMFGLFAEIERDLISLRTKEALAAAKAKGKLLGRPKGTYNSILDGKEEEIKQLLAKRISKTSIARILDTSPTNLLWFIKSRRIKN